ncbi:myosin-1-like isoform X2 [Asparagus officinalis]|uniref:myosin-1-like isoform X2 n=1 Tax=Asparagus officinalis TaxID=4686 RepID=UPI00098DEAB2|nr:myosin-1-like isoform X2 [Asparagus officinalis]
MSSHLATRSSLEEMLEVLRQRDTKPKEKLLPGLPSRPAGRGRLPSQKRTLPVSFEVKDTEEDRALKIYQEMVLRSSIFGSRRVGILEQEEESPYGKRPEIINYGGRWECVHGLDSTMLDEKFSWGKMADNLVTKKFRVWCKLPDGRWKLGTVKSVKGEDVNILLTDGKVLLVSIENVLPANPDICDDVDDLVQLGYINEPSVLHSLKHRYSRDMIYTKAGEILVAINPFRKVPLYGNSSIAAYNEKSITTSHVYAVADSAFRKMMKDGANQSIIISGESGSGKTETAKIAMQFLAALGGGSGIEREVLQSNIILEAFGNAKTSINDNSSRFGKLIEIQFLGGKFCGSRIQTFLLEKSRVVGRAKGERSYHVFYQLCAGAPALLKEKLNLKAAHEYQYLKQSECVITDNIDDAKRFHELMEALNIIQISNEKQHNAFAMLAAVLWLGNIEFLVIDNEDHVEVISNEGVTSAAKLLGCRVPELMLTLSTRRIQAGSDEVVQRLTLSQAIDTRDALARSIYASLFDWLVEQINKSLEVGKLFTGRSINILDIYGFESLDKNNFEQLCINYANERLQQHFNRHLFKLEQEEYIQDGIDWTYIEYVDNTHCLNLFEKPLGLFALLDEESASPKGIDLTFEYRLKQHLNSSPCFNGDTEGAFEVCHYAGAVLYDIHGFLEKNRDPLSSECIQLLLSCDCQLSQLFAARMLSRSHNQVGSSRRASSIYSQKQSVATKFKGQLFTLMKQLENTTPHFIQCIMPNYNKLPGVYEDKLVLQQLRCCGVLQAARISRLGYQTRMTHYQFAERYGFLLLKNVASEDPLFVALAVLRKFSIPPEMYQVGYTKLFFRRGQIVLLENIRSHTMQRILWVQKSLRSLQGHRHFQEVKKGAITLQSFIRGSLVRKNLKGSKTYYKIVTREAVQNQANKGDTDKVNVQTGASALVELEMQVLKAGLALRQKEEENVLLKKQLMEYEMKCLDNEAAMKSMQESWQKQVISLQAVKNTHQPGPNGGIGKNSDSIQNTVGPLVREFEHRKQDFEDEAQVIIEAKLPCSSKNPEEELRKLKSRFLKWKKVYNGQLKDAKKGIRKLVVSDRKKAVSDKKRTRRKWWKLRWCLTK